MLQTGQIIATVVGAVVLLIACVLFLNRPQIVEIDAPLPPGFPADGFSHRVFEELLQTYVDAAGTVDYGRWHAAPVSMANLDSYLAAVQRYSPDNAPERFGGRHDELAYWMYAYNAFVIRSILDRWPLASVTDVRAPIEVTKGFGFFYRQRFIFGETPLSLYAVENDRVRREYQDARIHFVLNCGSGSCPAMRPELPAGEALEASLQQAAIEFVSETRNVRIDHGNRRIVLSAIFKWYEDDFINDLRRRSLPVSGGLRAYVASVAPEPLRNELQAAADYEVVFDPYDWSVNDRK